MHWDIIFLSSSTVYHLTMKEFRFDSATGEAPQEKGPQYNTNGNH